MGKDTRGEGSGRGPDKVGERCQQGGGEPDRGVRADITELLKVVGPGRPLGGVVEDGVQKALRGRVAAGTAGLAILVPGGPGAEGTLPRSHLVPAARIELVAPDERVGLQ